MYRIESHRCVCVCGGGGGGVERGLMLLPVRR